MKTARIVSTVFLALFLLTAAGISAYWWTVRPLVGDDIFYALDLRQRGATLLDLPGQMAAVWMGCNARMGDMVNTVWLEMLPRWVGAVVSFVATAALPLCVMALGGAKRRLLLPAAIVAATVWLLPWWDMSHLVCIINYPWGAALAFACLIPLLSGKINSWIWILASPIAFFAGAYHEALGLPIAFGLVCWIIYNRKNLQLNIESRVWVAALIAGGGFTLTSPAIWNRLGSSEAAEPMLRVLLSSANLTLILAAAVLIIVVFNRSLFKKLLADPFLMLSIAAIASTTICAVSGVIGRSGFFAQLFALTALSRIYVFGGFSTGLNVYVRALLAVVIYAGCSWQAVRNYLDDAPITRQLQTAYLVYDTNPQQAYEIVVSLPEFDAWDAASLKCLDPRYDRQHDRNDSFPLNRTECR